MKRPLQVLITPILIAFLPWAAEAACATGAGVIKFQGNGNGPGTLRNLLQGKTVCGRPGPAYPGAGNPGGANDRWQEEHLGGPTSGELWDYKLGSSSTMDPRKQVGTWSISDGAAAADTITHSYSGGSSFSWTVYGPQTNTPGTSVYSFCNGTNEFARGYVLGSTNVGCGTYPP
jgi:hypothetical protein